ncbi:MAG: glycosyltransferase family 39 protein [Ignavibacteriales bacterium]|nr:glycosyltransferase family 39 protein [Ignavibacteriales bacterium]
MAEPTTPQSAFEKIFLHSWRPYAWLLTGTLMVYGHIISFSEYTYYDDYILIGKNFSHIEHLSDIGKAFFEDAGHQGQGGTLYRPLLTISFILDAQLSGKALWAYRFTDVALHAVSCFLLFVFLNLLGFKRSFSFVASILFCVHPALTQTVAWIPGRNDSLLTVFVLACFISFLKFSSAPSAKRYFLQLLFFTLAMFTKENAIALAPLALIYYAVIKKEKLFSLTVAMLLVGWMLVVVNWYFMRYISGIAQITDWQYAFSTVLASFWIPLVYLGKILWPFDLAFALVTQDMNVTAGIIGLLVICMLIVISEKKNWEMIFFGVAWFALFLAPTLFHHSDLYWLPKYYEHRIYTPFIGVLIILFSLSLPAWLRLPKSLTTTISIFVIGGLGLMSFRHSHDFENAMTLREFAARKAPSDITLYSAVEQMHLPTMLLERIKKAREHSSIPLPAKGEPSSLITMAELKLIQAEFEQQQLAGTAPAITIGGQCSLAPIYFARGFLVTAEKELKECIENDSTNADLRFNLGVIYYDAHNQAKAETEWLEALQLNPTMGDAHHNLCYLYYEQKRYAAAWQHCQEALKLGVMVVPNLIEDIRGRIKE